MKRTIAVLLAMIMLFVAMPLAASADTPASDDVILTIDGVTYRAHQGEIIEYVVYLCTGEMLCSLDGELFFSPDGLELVPKPTEDLSLAEQVFPRIGSSAVLNIFEPGHAVFNFSSAQGKSFEKETSKLIKTQFCVIAASGTYELKTVLHVVCGADEKKYIYRDVVENPLKRYETEITDKAPYVPDETEPAAEEPTEPVTDVPTEEPTVEPTAPAPRVLTDPITGVTVEHETADALSVTAVDPGDYRYFLFRAANLSLYDIALIKDGENLIPDEPVNVTIPAFDGAKLFRLGDLAVSAVESAYSADRLAFCDKDLGLFVISADGSVPAMTMYGNVDGDADVTVIDATHIQRDLAGIESFTDEQKQIGDTDSDKKMTIVDATHIQRWLAGLDSSLDRFSYPRTK